VARSKSRKPRGYGRGDIDETSTGRYKARILLHGVRRSRTFDTYADAERWLDNLLDGVESAKDMRVGEWLDLWARDFAPRCSEPTKDFRRWAIDKLEPLHTIKLRALRHEHVSDYLHDLAHDGYAANTLRRIRGVLSASLKTARAQERVTLNACDTVQIPEEAAPKKERRSLTSDERDRLLENAADSEHEALLALGLYLALRPGEITGLRWRDVDLDERVALVRQSRRVVGGRMQMTSTKTKGSVRKVRIPAELVGILRRHATRQKRLQMRSSRWHDSGLVVTTNVGTPVDPNRVRRIVRKACHDAGIYPAITPHEMRHTALTLLREAGVPLGALRQLAGHADLRMLTADYYHDTLDVAEAADEWEVI
jgi:integrase